VIAIIRFLAPVINLPSSFLGGHRLARQERLGVYAIGSLGAFFGPSIMGILRENTGGYSAAMAALSSCTGDRCIHRRLASAEAMAQGRGEGQTLSH